VNDGRRDSLRRQRTPIAPVSTVQGLFSPAAVGPARPERRRTGRPSMYTEKCATRRTVCPGTEPAKYADYVWKNRESAATLHTAGQGLLSSAEQRRLRHTAKQCFRARRPCMRKSQIFSRSPAGNHPPAAGRACGPSSTTSLRIVRPDCPSDCELTGLRLVCTLDLVLHRGTGVVGQWMEANVFRLDRVLVHAPHPQASQFLLGDDQVDGETPSVWATEGRGGGSVVRGVNSSRTATTGNGR